MNENIKLQQLKDWIKGEKYGYLLEDGETWVNYGDLEDKFLYDENKKKWELSRNRMIDKTIKKIKELILSDKKELYYVEYSYIDFEGEIMKDIWHIRATDDEYIENYMETIKEEFNQHGIVFEEYSFTKVNEINIVDLY